MMTRHQAARRLALSVCLALAVVSCGNNEPPPKAPESVQTQPAAESEAPSGMSVGAEIGGLNERAVVRVFEKASEKLTECWEEGSRRLVLMDGEITFYVKVDSQGRAVHAHAEQSSLGDRETERCMLDVLKAQSWPRPVGGEHGIARSGMGFSASPDLPRPSSWEAGNVQSTLDELSESLQQCRAGSSGRFTATAYLKAVVEEPGAEERTGAEDAGAAPVEIGQVLTVGVAPPDEQGEAAVDCMIGVLSKGKFPPPARPTKVTFSF